MDVLQSRRAFCRSVLATAIATVLYGPSTSLTLRIDPDRLRSRPWPRDVLDTLRDLDVADDADIARLAIKRVATYTIVADRAFREFERAASSAAHAVAKYMLHPDGPLARISPVGPSNKASNIQ